MDNPQNPKTPYICQPNLKMQTNKIYQTGFEMAKRADSV